MDEFRIPIPVYDADTYTDDELPGMWERADLIGGETDLETPKNHRAASCLNVRCNRPRSDFPMAFSRDPYCSDNCRKLLGLGLPPIDARH